MADISRNYVKLIYKRYHLFPTWLPNVKIMLGDVGVVEGGYFSKKTTLKRLGVNFTKRIGDKPLSLNDDLTAGLNVQALAEGDVSINTVPLAKAVVNIDFSKEGAFLFHAVDCYTDEIEDKVTLGQALLGLGGKWDLHWSVVDTVVRAGSTTILVANSQTAKLELKAKGALDISNLAKPELGLKLVHKEGDVTQFLAQKGLTPLFGLSKFHRSWIEWLLGNPPTIHFGETHAMAAAVDVSGFGGPRAKAAAVDVPRSKKPRQSVPVLVKVSP